MGKHSRPEPKKISFLGSVGGIFAAVLLAGGLFATSQLSNSDPIKANPPVEIPVQVPDNMVVTGTAVASLPGPVVQDSPVVNVPAVGIPTPTQSPTLSPTPDPSPGTRTPDVNIDVDTPVGGLDIDVDLPVPLLGSAVDTVEDITHPLTDLLGE